jgi:hypothetical protein
MFSDYFSLEFKLIPIKPYTLMKYSYIYILYSISRNGLLDLLAILLIIVTINPLFHPF